MIDVDDDQRVAFRLERLLEKAYFSILDTLPCLQHRIDMLWAYVDWQEKVNIRTPYHLIMWAETNKDLLQEWVLNYIIEQEWA